MSMLDTWTDDTAGKAQHWLRVGQGNRNPLMQNAERGDRIRPAANGFCVATAELGLLDEIRRLFAEFQQFLYQEAA
jgi:hypothetical protein